MKRWVFVLFLGVAGCANQADMTRNSIAYYGPSCQALGLTPKTPEFANCILKYEQMYGSRSCVPMGGIQVCSPQKASRPTANEEWRQQWIP